MIRLVRDTAALASLAGFSAMVLAVARLVG